MSNVKIDKTDKYEVEMYRYHAIDEFSKRCYEETFGKTLRINSKKNYEENFECWGCGIKVKYYDEPNERVFCKECLLKHNKEVQTLLKEQQKIKSQIMLENAIKTIEESKSYAHEFKESYEEIKKMIEKKPTLFKSSDEVVVAMVLTNYGYEYIPNHKIENYIIDFYIEELKICLEVDGERHKNHLTYDKERDMKIRSVLGADWEVVRIPTKFIPVYPDKIIDAMIELKKEMQEQRKRYGILKDNFSEREEEYYQGILSLRKQDIEKRKEKEDYNRIKKYFEEKKTRVPKSSE